ncbi:MAG: hypothetical protein ACRBCI_14835 [Cellvibrionaceae bacterium]
MSTAIAETTALDLSVVQPADIIVTRSSSNGSRVIRGGTCGVYSHAILALRDGKCIEAMPETGVSIRPLKRALDDSSYAALYRHKLIDSEYATWVCHHAKKQNGKKYDMQGAMRSGVATGCGGILKGSKLGFAVQLFDDLSKTGGRHSEKFFCSELIAYAFQKAALPLFKAQPHEATPSKITYSDKLALIEELITA